MQILRAAHLGMCFGVRDAIDLALRRSDTAPLTVLGDLVHNDAVLAGLRARGIATAKDPAQAATRTVMVTAHGTSERSLARTRALGLEVVDATCPLVHVAHRAVQALVRDGYHPVIIGQRGHVEVRGLTEDLDAFDVVLDETDVLALTPRPRLGVAAQTTQPVERVRRLVACIRQRFAGADVRFIDTVCRPTKQRQTAAIDLARRADVVIVVGGAASNNTRQLVETCARYCARVHHVQADADLCADWFRGVETVGLTAGTSTPDEMVDRVEGRIRALAAADHAGVTGRIGGRTMMPGRSWMLVAIFAVAMAWVEAAVVYDLRVLVDRLQPYQPDPLPIAGALGNIELVREVATLVMLAAVGGLAGNTLRARLAYSAIAFGIWDIFYYASLKVMYGWPASLLDWDVLFLLPLPWWGPVIAPMSIAVLMIVWGTLVAASPALSAGRSESRLWPAAGLGAALALYTFMADAVRAAPQGIEAVRAVLPATFNWPMFLVALALMAAPVAAMVGPLLREIELQTIWARSRPGGS